MNTLFRFWFAFAVMILPLALAHAEGDEERVAGKWEWSSLELGKHKLRIEKGGKWAQEVELYGKTTAAEGTWKLEKAEKVDSGILIKPQFVLHLENWAEADAPLPAGAIVNGKSRDGKQVMVRETFQGAILEDKSGKTLVLYRLAKNGASDIPSVVSRRYSRVE